MATVRNPFVIGKYVGPEYFCDRQEETRLLAHHIMNGRNTVVISERRLGKTGLIEHTLYQPDIQKEYYCFFIDIYALHSLKELVCELANEVFRRLATRQQNFIQRFTSIVRSIQTSFSLDQFSGTPQVNFSLGDINQTEVTLDELLKCLEGADRPCIVAIDEFQQITTFEEKNIEAILRTKVQHLKNVQFIFAGSKKHLLEGIFNSPDRPFYNSVVFLPLAPIEEQTYISFAQKLFLQYGKELAPELTQTAYKYFQGVTWYLQLFMNEAFAVTERGSKATTEDFDEILQHLIDTKRFTFEETYSRLTEKQKAVLRAIATDYPKTVTPTSKDFLERYRLKTASSVQTAMKGLTDKGILSEYGNSRQISDILFLLWLRQRG